MTSPVTAVGAVLRRLDVLQLEQVRAECRERMRVVAAAELDRAGPDGVPVASFTSLLLSALSQDVAGEIADRLDALLDDEAAQ